MKLRFLTLLAFMTFWLFQLSADAAMYSWYFSNNALGNPAGNDTTGDGSQFNPWKTLMKAQKKINSLSYNDTVNLFFDRGDTWSKDTGATVTITVFGLTVDSSGPTVNIDAYGSGDKPVFDGLVTDFRTASVHNKTTGPKHWNSFFEFARTDCSVSNVEIKNVYGNGIYLRAGDGFTLSNCLIHNFGSSAINIDQTQGIEDCLIEYNTLHTGQLLRLHNKRPGWGGAIHFIASGNDDNSLCRNNTVRYNLVYDIKGEGINASNSTVEYNVVGDTMSVAIDTAPHDYDEYTNIVRYNYIVGSSSTTYGRGTGMRVFDETTGGDNSNGVTEMYGNVIINRNYGVRVYCDDSGNNECGNTHGTVRIYNNLVIDAITEAYRFSHPKEVSNGYAYNNVSIHYDRDGKAHATNASHANWTFSHNAFYPVDVDDTVGTGWVTNYVTGNPKLPGESLVDWTGLSSKNYLNLVDFGKHLLIPTDSSLANAGKILGSGYNSMFLTSGTDFSKINFQKLSQPATAKWCIGPIIPQIISGKPKPKPDDPNQPNGFRVVKK